MKSMAYSASRVAASCLASLACCAAVADANWTGEKTGQLVNKVNYQQGADTGSLCFNDDNLTGNRRTSLWIREDIAKFRLGDAADGCKGMFFKKGNAWELHTNLDGNDTIFSYDNSDGGGGDDRICIGCGSAGESSGGDAALRLYDVNVKTKYLYVGSTNAAACTSGALVLTNYAGGAHAPVGLHVTSDMQIYNGRVESMDASVAVDGIINIGYSDNASGELVVNGGSWQTTRLWMSRADNDFSKFVVRGGSFTTTGADANGRICVGAADGVSTNYVEISGGAVDCSGGTCFALGWLGGPAARSELLVSGGTLRCRHLYVGNYSSARATVAGGMVDASGGRVYFAYNANCTADKSCELDLDGGTLATKGVQYRAGTAPATLNLNGGVLKACEDGTLVQAHGRLSVLVGAGGAAIDTNRRSVRIEEPLAPASGVAGDLTVTGGGVAAFTNPGGLSGAFTVGEGTSLRWFDQDGTVAQYGVGELNIAPGSVLFLDADATGCDRINAGATHVTATSANPAVLVLVSGAALADSVQYSVLDADDASLFDVRVIAGGAPVPCTKAIIGGHLVVTAAPSAAQTDDLPSGVWTGWAGSLSMRDPLNWRNGRLPVAADTLDFSSVAVDAAIAADIPSAPAYAGLAMGPGVVTFSGDVRVGSIDDSSKVAVGANSTVTVEGDMLVGGSGDKWIVHSVGEGGAFVVTGRLGIAAGSSCRLYPQCTNLVEDAIGRGAIVAGGLVNNGSGWLYSCVNKTRQRWVVGAGGIGGTASDTGVWVLSDISCEPVFQPDAGDFAVSLRSCLRENIGSFTLDTTGWGDGIGHTVRLDAGCSDSGDQFYIRGAGRVVCNHAPIAGKFGGYPAYSGCAEVCDTATLALNAGCRLTSGPTIVRGGARLEIAQSGTADAGEVVMEEDSTLAFNFTERGTAPKLRLAKGLRGTVPVRICSYNMRCITAKDTGDRDWESRKEAFVKLIENMDPDIIGFQEGRIAQNAYLEDSLHGWSYLSGSGAFTSGGVEVGFLPIAFRKGRFTLKGEGTFWLSDTPATVGSTFVGSYEPRICHWVQLTDNTTGEDCVFASAHLDLYDVRTKEMNVILNSSAGLKDKIDSGIPLVIVGDMNCFETENTIRNAKKRLNDAFLVSQTEPTGPWRSYNGFGYKAPASEVSCPAQLRKGAESRNSDTGNQRIDFVLVSKDIVVKSFACRNDTQGDVMGNGVEQYPSDHFPQLVDLMLPTRGAAGRRFTVSVGAECPADLTRGQRLVLTDGAGLTDAEGISFRIAPGLGRPAVEDGEIVLYGNSRGLRFTLH